MSSYSSLEKLLHRLAFANLDFQHDLGVFESRTFAARLLDGTSERPVFVTSLPRAGTTLLLSCLSSVPELASHTYRDMPFLLCPMMWAAWSAPFQSPNRPVPRMHGDGMEVSYDTAEAFDEVIWRMTWPEKYAGKQIALWQALDRNPHFEEFFRDHMRKIVALRAPGGRYLSKNNANIARVDFIRAAFPDANIVVPFRHPLVQATSLLRQHRRFLEIHAEEPFVKRYMGWLGHLEFGALHQPIAFPGTVDLAGRDPLTLDYWLVYWIAAFEHLLERVQTARLILFGYETCCERPAETLNALGAAVGVRPERLTSMAVRWHRPTQAAASPTDHAVSLRALTLYDQLCAEAIIR